ncbi:MAG: DsbA family protein [Actinomycetota bacterium]|jgi:predicted DsbA family dithiol-disulfide isomerase|nr:DsbA family protein [Actinomycetota bacterium]
MAEVEAAEDAGVALRWSPYELRPAPDALPDPRGRYIRDHWRDHVYPLAVQRGVEIHVPTAQPRSTLTLAAAGFAYEQGAGRAFREAVHAAFFVEGHDVGDERVLRMLARRCGLDGDALVAAAWDPARLTRLRDVRAEAQAAGVYGVPSLTVGGRLAFFGAPPPGVVGDALRRHRDDPDALRDALGTL